MRPLAPLALLSLPLLAACMPAGGGGTAAPTRFASPEEGCRLEAAFLTGVAPSAIRVTGSPETGTLLLDLGGRAATCRFGEDGQVTSIEL